MTKSFLKTFAEVQKWFDRRDFPALAFDTETDGLRFGSPIVGISFCDGEKACYINLWDNQEQDLIIKYLDVVLEFTDLLIGHNISYDLKVLHYHEVIPECDLYDTMVAAHLLNEAKGYAGLKFLMKKKLGYTDVKDWKDVKDLGYDSKEFQEYGITDAVATWQLYELTKPLIEKEGFHNLFYSIEMPFQRVIVDLEVNGIGIDQERLEDLDDILAAEKVILEQRCVESLGLKMIEENNLFGYITTSSPINLNSSLQLIDIIQNKIGLKLPYKTKPSKRFPEGQPSTKSQCLLPLTGKHPFIDLLSKYRKVEKLHNTFIEPLWGHLYPDGRIRSSFNDCLARTGRLTSSNPNNQNIPSLKKKDPYGIRKIYKTKKGYVFIQGDWSGQELRGCAHVSGDQTMVNAFLKDKDLHLATANEWLKLGIPEECLYKSHTDYKLYSKQFEKERDSGKNGVNFPIVYGTTAKGISWRQGIDEELAAAGIEAFFKLYPGVRKAVEECKSSLIKNRYVITLLGRKRRFNDYYKWSDSKKEKALRQAFNFLIQGLFSDVLRIAMVNLRQLFLDNPEWDAKLVLTVHDSVTTEVKLEYADIVTQKMKETMENSYKISIPLPVDISMSETLE